MRVFILSKDAKEAGDDATVDAYRVHVKDVPVIVTEDDLRAAIEKALIHAEYEAHRRRRDARRLRGS